MKKLAALLILLVIAFPCMAATKKADAEKWLTDFRAARQKTGDALFLNDPVKRAKHTQVIMGLRDRADQLFGQSTNCSIASNYLVTIWTDEIGLARSEPNPHISASSLANLAWEAGQNYGMCRDSIDAMK